MQSGKDPAAARFWTLRAVQLVGIVVTLIGVAGVGERIAMPQILAGLLLAAGVGIFFGLPVALARRWKSEK